jgi:hypothetical protein
LIQINSQRLVLRREHAVFTFGEGGMPALAVSNGLLGLGHGRPKSCVPVGEPRTPAPFARAIALAGVTGT